MPDIVGRLRTPRLAVAPSSPAPGEMYYDTVLAQLLYWDGTKWSQGPVGTVYDSDYVGTVKAFAGPAVPTNWMLADGRSLATASFPELFNVLGYKYGGSGANFNLPDLRSKFIYGVAQADLSDLGVTGGADTVTLTAGQMPSHNHGGSTGTDIPDHAHSGSTNTTGAHTHVVDPGGPTQPLAASTGATAQLGSGGTSRFLVTEWGSSTADGDHAHSFTTAGASARHAHSIPTAGSDQAHENLPPYIRLARIIKVTGAQINAGGALQGATGAKGDPGPWRGAWAAATAYSVGDSVSYFDGTVTGSYRRKVAGTTAGNPKTDTTNWELIASGGSVGANGAPGTVPVYEQPGQPSDTTVGAIWIDTDDVAPTYVGSPFVTSLPSNPVDGQEVMFLADATNGVIWHLRYRAASPSAYKWEFLGGAPLYSAVDTDQVLGPTATAYTDLATVGPSIALPRPGDYDIDIGVRIWMNGNNGAAWMSYAIGATAPLDTDAIEYFSGNSNWPPTVAPQTEFSRRKTGLTAVTLTAKYKVSNAPSATDFYKRWMKATPVRLS